MSRTCAIGLFLGVALMTAGCQRPVVRPGASADGTSDARGAAWTDAQRRAFRAAHRSARDKLYRQLRQVRVGPKARLDRLVRDRAVSAEELRALAASAPIRRVTWLQDGRCRVVISLGLIRVVDALDRWDRQGKWAPHYQVLELNDSLMLRAVAASERG